MAELKDNTPEIDINAVYELIGGMYIQLLRIYDLLALIASGTDKTKVENLISLHESGKYLSPDPAISLDDE
jgi:hypothetical protein